MSLMQAWWAAPIGRAVGQGGHGTSLAMSQFSPLVFVTHGITPLGYAAFVFTLGVTAGALIQRTVPAMAVTLASHGIGIAVTYQPASRYWLFQWTETGICIAVALALAGYCFRRLSRRLSC
jgi:hypothetical protein